MIASFLEKMKQDPRFRRMFQNYTLSHDSLSLQSGTFEKPRALIFSDDARLIVTFNDENSERGSYALETAEYDPATRLLSYREILFKKELPAAMQSLLVEGKVSKISDNNLGNYFLLARPDIAFENESVVISTANPSKCMQCHQTNEKFTQVARYIWDGYSDWPRFYGQTNDTLNTPEKDNNGHDLKDYKNFDENFIRNSFKKFKDTAKADSKSRYHTLEQGNDPVFPYLDEKAGTGNEHKRRPNLRLTKMMGIYQSEVFAQLLAQKISQDQIHGIARGLLCDDNFEAGDQAVLAHFPEHLTLNGESNGFNEDHNKGVGKYFLGSAPMFFGSIDKYIKSDFKYMVTSVLVSNYLRSRKLDFDALTNSIVTKNRVVGTNLAGTNSKYADTFFRYFDLTSEGKELRQRACALLK